MDWLRRNWPDLLIGVALIAVIAGIIATLISGGSFFPANNRSVDTPDQGSTPLTSTNTPGAAGDQASADAPGDAGAADPADADLAPGAAQSGEASTLTTTAADGDAAAGDAAANAAAAGADPAAAGANGAAAGNSAANTNDSLPVAVLPPGQAAQPAGAAASPAPTPATSTVTSTAANAQPAADVSASALPDAPYRVSVGAYANRGNAERQAEAFEAAGYPVFIGIQDALNIVLVGPYDDEAEARSVAARIRTADMGVSDPTVYEFTPDEAAQASAAGAGDAASAAALTSSVSTSAAAVAAQAGDSGAADDDTVITSAPSTAPGVRYLQVGAYATRDSSLPQRARLEGLGFVVTEREESDLVKLLIGPFDAANLS